MKSIGTKYFYVLLPLILLLMQPGSTAAQTVFSHVVIFGSSLSDSGNAFFLTGMQSVPPYERVDEFLVPDAAYAKGGHHLSNGATWIEQLTRPLSLAGEARPASQGSGNNYAVGAARARNDGINFDLPLQVSAFLQNTGGTAPSDALYTLEFGGNDIRDAVEAAIVGGNPDQIIQDALNQISDNITALYQAGARLFLVWNVPDVGLSPAVGILDQLYPGVRDIAEALTVQYNIALGELLAGLAALPEIRIIPFDAYQVLNSLVADPGAYGLKVVDRACIMPNQPPFECKKPDEFLFWDGVHPTKAVHGILANAAAFALAQP